MLKIRAKGGKGLYVVILVAVVLFAGLLGSVLYYGNQKIARQQDDARERLAQMDKALTEAKTKTPARQTADAKKDRQPPQKDTATPHTCAISGSHGDPNRIDVVINKKHCFSPLNFAPKDLVSYGGYLVSAKMEPSLDAMFKAAAAAGVPMGLSSTYRPYDGQVVTYNHWVAVNGSTAAADTVSARPGYSEHQTGFAADLEISSSCTLECFAGSAQYKWLIKHAADYGFIERYQVGYEDITGYSPEAWHWRYVGSQTAKEMKAKGIKTLEQLWGISGGGY